ncbi:MAG: hypothetical protein ACK5RG_02250 [Cyclobacteriaceae bacterium]|jgi:hypothetical protein|nr:hypothetical protein [Flammeovirgaceae bacterium]
MVPQVKDSETLHVLMVGNNPIELSSLVNRLSETRSTKINTEFAFDWKSSLNCLASFTPSHIIIDDNIGKQELQLSVNKLQSFRKTKNIPITVLKNSNYQETLTEGILNYVLKSNISPDSLYKSLGHSVKYRQAQEYLQQAFKKRKSQLAKLLHL